MRLTQPWCLRDGFSNTAMRSHPIFRDYGLPSDVRRAELKRKLFRILYPNSDRRQKGPRSREAALWLNEPLKFR
jgi:hypothetical protein